MSSTNVNQTQVQRGVVFDFGQVLTLNQDRSRHRPILDLLGVTPESFYPHWHRYRTAFDKGDLNAQDYWHKVLADAGIPSAREVATQEWKRFLEIDISSFDQPRPRMAALVEELVDRNVPVAILSNMPPGIGVHWERRWPWLHRIPESLRLWSGDLDRVKPNRDFFELLLGRISMKPGQLLFVDDIRENIDAARSLGFEVCHFTDEDRGIEHIRQWCGLT